jgi:enoyl-CoA hydratase
MSEVLLEIEGSVAVVTLNAPERRNALNDVMTGEIIAICEEIDGNPAIGAAVIRGAGPTFCAGADRNVLRTRGQDVTGATPTAVDGYRSFARVGELKVPTIAAVRGAAVGAGLNLVFATDLRIVAEDARLMAGFLRIGIHPGGGHFALVARTAGREAAIAMAIFGQEMSGRRAAEVGAAWEALPADQVEPRAMELAGIAGADPELARAILNSMRLELGPPGVSWPAALEMERAAQAWSLRRRALKEGG